MTLLSELSSWEGKRARGPRVAYVRCHQEKQTGPAVNCGVTSDTRCEASLCTSPFSGRASYGAVRL